MNTNAVLTVGPSTSPKRASTAQGIVIRYGYQPMGDTGFSKYVEHLFRKMPEKETLKEIITAYNKENGIKETFRAADYGL